MPDSVIAIAAFGLSGWGFYGAYAFRTGRLRRMGRWYFDRSQPLFLRNSAFGLLPAGLFGMAGMTMLLLAGNSSVWAQIAVTAATLVAFTTLVLGLVWTLHPPIGSNRDGLSTVSTPSTEPTAVDLEHDSEVGGVVIGHRISMTNSPAGGPVAASTYDLHGRVSLLLGDTSSAAASDGYRPSVVDVCLRDGWGLIRTSIGLQAAISLVLVLIACSPRPIEALVRCEGLPAIMCDQLTPVVIGNLKSSERSSVLEIRIVCSVEQCTRAEGAYRAWVRFVYGSERELPDGEWASG